MMAVTSHLGPGYDEVQSWELPVDEINKWLAERVPGQPDRQPFWDWVMSLPVTDDPRGDFIRDTLASSPGTREGLLAIACPNARKVYQELLEEWSWVSRLDELRSHAVEKRSAVANVGSRSDSQRTDRHHH